MNLRDPKQRSEKRERLRRLQAEGDAKGYVPLFVSEGLDNIAYIDELEARIEGLQQENEHLRELLGEPPALYGERS